MIRKRLKGDLKIAYRPYRIDEVIGNDRIKRIFENYFKKGTLPHFSLFIGPPGCGKTTFARIVALGLNCEKGPTPNPCCVCDTCKSIIHQNSMAVLEVDGVSAGNKAYIQELVSNFSSGNLNNERAKVIIIDEAHVLTDKGEDVLLKPSEDTPEHVYIILCTNHPEKLKDATLDRCKAGTIQFGRLPAVSVYELIEQVAQFEGMEYKEPVLKYISENCEGTPRGALGILQMVAAEGSWTVEATEDICNVGTDVDTTQVLDFCRVLLNGKWRDLVPAFDKIKNIPPETTRIAIAGYLSGCLRKAKTNAEALKFSRMLDYILIPYYGPKPEHFLLNTCFKIGEVIRNGE